MQAPNPSPLDSARERFRADLVDAGLLIPTAVPGLYGRSGVLESIIDAVDARIRRAGAGAHGSTARVLRFPPVYPREAFDRTDYIASFPNLTGSVATFRGDDRAHAELLATRAEGGDWDHFLEPAGTMLVSAACHPAYPTLTGTLPEEGALLDVYGYCFRHEPAIDPARLQAFRMHEFVRVGTPEQARAHRESWLPRALSVLTELGLDAVAAPANDPFFGRAGRMLASNQRTAELKTELLVRLYGDLDEGTAVVSCNSHQDHFGSAFGIDTADGAVAHSACVGFGMERIALAMLRTHGLSVEHWPAPQRALLAVG
ncbi:amino acid--[acyl-carrier-protein] ligase [Rhodococcus daqingensis]|uniref:Amino acid--[acyl-carrier-protein] ligase n=1 Tax=Rhodococcus daqingensis TaxID=2479363 RepID=A0ABW2RRP8_9NOCA